MRSVFQFGVALTVPLALLLVASCAGDEDNPAWKAICTAICERSEDCFSVPVDACIPVCLDEFRNEPCESDDQVLSECVAAIADLECQALDEGELPRVCNHVCTGGLCEGVDCDDGIECTDDICDPVDGSCDNDPLPDGTPCSEGGCEDLVCTSVFSCTEHGILTAIAAGGGPYTFTCNGPTIVKTTDRIRIDKSVILDGEGNLTVDGNDSHLVFSVGGPSTISVELRGLTITGGASEGVAAIDVFGGGPSAMTGLTLTDCSVSGNAGSRPVIGTSRTLTLNRTRVNENLGGGIQVGFTGGTLTLNQSIVSDNNGTGIEIGSGGVVTLNITIVSGNFGGMGGINSHQATLVLNKSTVSDNLSDFAEGGGIFNLDGTSALNDSTVSGNMGGGGIVNHGTLTLVNSTVSDNDPGGIINESQGIVLLTHTTVSNHEGFAISTRGPLTLENSLVDGMCWCASEDACSGVIISNGHNIESPGDTCGFDEAKGDKFDVTEAQLNLGPLANNGGPTMTHKPGDGGFDDGTSVAIDHIPGDACDLTEDQRGQPRPETGGTMCDVGAFEVQP